MQSSIIHIQNFSVKHLKPGKHCYLSIAFVFRGVKELTLAEFEPGTYYIEEKHSSTEQKATLIVSCQLLIIYCLRNLLREMSSLQSSLTLLLWGCATRSSFVQILMFQS